MSLGKPKILIHEDKRHCHIVRRSISDQGESMIVDQILESNRLQKQLTFKVIRTLFIDQWKTENINKKCYFTASDGWMENLIGRHNLSSQLVSKHSSSEPKQKQSDQKQRQLIIEYRDRYHTLIDQHGSKTLTILTKHLLLTVLD